MESIGIMYPLNDVLCASHFLITLINLQCIPQTWYLSVDVQLHILSPLILFWLLGSRRTAWTGLTVGVAAALIASTAYVFLKDYEAEW